MEGINMAAFLKQLLINLVLLLVMGVVLYLIAPDIMGQVFGVYGALFGPLALVMLVVFALPRKSRRR